MNNQKYIASVSFGKDSLAMLLKLLDDKFPLDAVVFYNTGMEFEEIYKIRDSIIPLLNERGIKFVELKPKRRFIDTMINYPHQTRTGKIKMGYGWCGGLCRWGTTEKLKSINEYCKDAIQLIGIAYDEKPRLERLHKQPNKYSPLESWKMTEQQCLEYCYSKGYDWGELYKYLKRVSCWCCRNKNLKEISNYKQYLPKYYEMLCELEEQIGEPMKPPYTLIERFEKI